MTKELTIEKIDCEDKLGKWLDDDSYDQIITEDTDLYAMDRFGGKNGEHNVIFKFRKGVFSSEEQQGAFEGLAPAAIETQNRGLAAGPRAGQNGKRDWVTPLQEDILDGIFTAPDSTLDDEFDAIDNAIARHRTEEAGRGRVWLRDNIKKTGVEYSEFFDWWLDSIRPLSPAERKLEAKSMVKNYISDTSYANTVNSGIAGWFDRYPRIPYGRATAYTEKNPELFAKSYPYLQTLARKFEELLPERYAKQKAFTDAIDPAYVVPETPYTTLTVNRTFRTAAHRDAGDYTEGFSNISCISPGDLLLVNNHEGIHGNTEIIGDDPIRISIVAYAREKMALLGSYEYETLRRQYVDDRRLNEEHPEWRPLWNGVSTKMWDATEWYDYLREHGGQEMLDKYHPQASAGTASLADLF